MLKLVAKSGFGKGASWDLEEGPLLIGRDRACAIHVADPLVSRRHCEISLENGIIHLQDLGSSNATFVNGKAVKQRKLRVGDEVCVGQVLFEIMEGDDAPLPEEKGLSDSTVSLAEGEVAYLSDSTLEQLEGSGIHNVADVLQLFRHSRAFSRIKSADELLGELEKALMTRFEPSAFWIALVSVGDGHLDYVRSHVAAAFPEARPPEEAIRRAIEESRGFLMPERATGKGGPSVKLTLIAPIFFGEHRIGALALEAQSPDNVYEEGDLHYLVALANAAAPFFGAIEQRNTLEREIRLLRSAHQEFTPLVGSSSAMQRLKRLVAQVAASNQPILIIGETGTGKELVANLVHRLSDRAEGPLVTVNCAAIPNDLIESELFGYEKGAFTGANARKIGLFQQSDGGTLFLDEVGDLSPESQARILRALETKRFRRVGGKKEIAVDFRVVAATNKDISDAKYREAFRRDLYHRLHGVEIRIPPLSQRRSDIPELAEHFLEQAKACAKHPVRGFAPEALDFLSARAWAGNVRELKNCIETAVVLSQHEVITPEDFHMFAEGAHAPEKPARLAEVEKEHILKAVEYCGGKVVDAAGLLGVSKTKVYERLAEYRKTS